MMPNPKHYAIFGLNTELDLEETKQNILNEIKSIERATVSDDGSIQFDFQAYGFIDVYADHKEVRAEVQSMSEQEMLKAQGYIQAAMLKALNEPKNEDMVWRDITEVVLADKLKNAEAEANN